MTIWVTQTGDFIAEDISSGRIEKTVNIPKTGNLRGRTSFTVNLEDDTDTENNGVVTATLQSGAGFVIGDYSNTATATIYDDDSLPVVTIANSGPVSEGDGTSEFHYDCDWYFAGY